jgi:hypothetical protein
MKSPWSLRKKLLEGIGAECGARIARGQVPNNVAKRKVGLKVSHPEKP